MAYIMVIVINISDFMYVKQLGWKTTDEAHFGSVLM